MNRRMRMDRGGTATLAMIAAVALGTLGRPAPGLAQAAQPPDQIDDVQQEQEIRRARLLAEYESAYQTATERLAQEDFEGAARAILTAQLQVRQNRDLLSGSQFAQLIQRADDLLAQIDEARIRAEVLEDEIRQRDIKRAQQDEQIRQGMERERLINENLRRVRQLQLELKYHEALQVIDEILFIDEHNPAAQALKEAIETTILYRKWDEVQRQKESGYGQLSWETQRSMVPPVRNLTGPGLRSTSGVMAYPPDWPNLSLLRTGEGGFRGSVADRRVGRLLAETRLPLDFSGNSLEQVVGFLGDTTGVPIYVDWKALGFIDVDREDQVTLQLNDVSLQTALDRILEQVGDELGDRPEWAIQDGILTISSNEALRRNVTTLVYDIRDLLFEVPYFDNAPDLNLNAALNQGRSSGGRGGGGGGGGGGFGGGGGGGGFGGGGGGGGRGGGSNIFGDPSDIDRVDRADLVTQIVSLIQDTVDPEGWRDLGGDTGTLQELNGNLIITNTPRNHQRIEGLLSQLREIRALQINVESRFLSVSSDWFEQIGVDLDLYFNTNNTLRQRQLAVDPQAHLGDLFDPRTGRLIDPFFFGDVVTADGTVIGARIPSGSTFGVPTVAGSGFPPAGAFRDYVYASGPVGAPLRTTSGFAPIQFFQDTLTLVDSIADLDPTSLAGLAAANPALVVGIQFLDDIQVDLLIEATQADKRSVVLTAPRLTFFNGQRSWVAVATQQAFVSALIPITGDAAGAFQPIIATLTDGFVLDVEGVISADRRYVTMTVIASQSQFQGFRESDATEFGGAAGGGFGGGGAAQFTGQIELPIIQLSLVQTTVSVPDRGTVLLGGQRKANEIEVETGIPILSKIPFINRFFTNRITAKTEETLLILIRPEIIIQQENEDLLFPGLSDTLGGAASYLDY